MNSLKSRQNLQNSRQDIKKTRKGASGVIGIDEVGRGPLAGPITVCAVYIKNTKDKKRIKERIFNNIIRDSKRLSKLNRNNIYTTIRKKRMLNMEIKYAISSRSAKYIDKYGIQRATSQCIDSCIRNLIKNGVDFRKIKVNLDAGLKIKDKNINQKSFVKGDEHFVEIALASIVAKVSRDKHMNSLHKQYEEYNWANNVGYGTKVHIEAIKKFGITKYHRKTYLKGFKLFERAE